MDELTTFFEGIAVPFLLSLFGGAAKALSHGVKSWRQFVGSLFVSGFAGVIVHLFIQDANLSASVKAALVGLSGYSGGAIQDALADRLQRGVAKLPVWDGVERRGKDCLRGIRFILGSSLFSLIAVSGRARRASAHA